MAKKAKARATRRQPTTAKRKAKSSTRKKAKAAAASKNVKRKRAANFKVFIAWSGDKSKAVGSKLQRRFQTILPNLKIIFSPSFTPGAAWANRLQLSLRTANYAILCVTKEGLDSRWMNFEAGAAWKALRQNSVCPLLLNVEANDLSGPLSLFQAKRFAREDFEQLCIYLGSKARTNANVVRQNLDAVWIRLEDEVKEILK